jgi:signal peptidase I
MTRLQDTDDGPGGGEAEGYEPSPNPLYDPLLASWEEAPASPRLPPADLEDLLFPATAVPATEEDGGWQMPPRAPSAPPYPDRYQPAYQERLTELQRRLRAETITIPRRRGRWSVTVRELTETLLLALLIFLSVRASLQNFRVEGASMEPSLENGEYLIVNKLSYAQLDLSIFDWLPFFDSGSDPLRHLWSSPQRGDVIVFRAPTSPNRDFIKRIIGVPGDTVHIEEGTGRVSVNGQVLDEPYIRGSTNCNAVCDKVIPAAHTAASRAECGSDACYFVMGDNRQNSSDSRQKWLVPEENIIGKALLTYWHQGGPELDLAPNHSIGGAPEAAAQE